MVIVVEYQSSIDDLFEGFEINHPLIAGGGKLENRDTRPKPSSS
jgi:hypothetical protein